MLDIDVENVMLFAFQRQLLGGDSGCLSIGGETQAARISTILDDAVVIRMAPLP